MDDIKPREGRYDSSRTQQRRKPTLHTSGVPPSKKERHQGEIYWLVRSLGKAAAKSKRNIWHRFQETDFARWPDKSKWQRLYALLTLVLFIISTIALTVQPFLDSRPNTIANSVRSVLPEPNQNLADYLEFDAKEAKFIYNSGYTGTSNPDLAKVGNGSPRISASFSKDPTKGVTVTDSINQVDFTLKPKYRLLPGKQDANQLFYQLGKEDGYLVYTSMIATVKEDIVLESANKDRLEFEYELVTAEGTEARLEEDGSVGIYGSNLPINGSVATGSEQDAELLQKVRENGDKTKLLFVVPAPVVKEIDKTKSSVSARFELDGNTLRVIAEGLKNASYPLSIDPSVYVQSAAQLMRGNNESNVEFDVANELFKKGTTTGARIDEWTETGAMNDATYDQGVAAAGGYMYRAGGRSGRIMPWVASVTESTQATDSTSFAMNMPSVRPSGDMYIAVLNRDGTGAVTAPGGSTWTLLANSTREHLVYCRIGGAGEPASYSWTIAAGVKWAGAILRIKDSNGVCSGGSAPTVTTQFNAADTNPGFPAVTATSQGALVLRSAGWDDDPVDDHGYAAQTTLGTADHDEIASGNSGGTAGVNYAISRLDTPPLSTVASPAATTPTVQNISDSYGSSSIAIYGNSATPAYNQTLQWAHFNSTDGTIDSPTPGSTGGACSGWCTNSAYNLPLNTGSTSDGVGNVGMSMIAYNGYLYAMGGYDGTNLKSTVYIAKLGANGEPSLWHPTNPSEASWVYWYKDTGLNGATARAYHSAYAYNGKMYMLGGRTSMSGATPAAVTTSEIASILPNGTLSTWSSGQAVPTVARYGMSVQAYNGYLYLIGGNNAGTMYNYVHYSRLNSDGTMNSWQVANVDGTSHLPTAKTSQGGLMVSIWGGYIYVAGGCTAVNTTGSGYCTTLSSDVQLASINADGSLDVWNTMANLRNTRFGSSFIAWQGSLYRFGGCSRQDAATGDCYAAHLDIQYGEINQDGDASTVNVTTAAGVGLCTGNDPYNCNLPPIGDGAGLGGQLLVSTAILNGYLYVLGGCASLACDTGANVSGNVSYTAIASDGKLKQPPSCSYSTYGGWCVDNVNQLNGNTGIAAAGVTVFGGRIYVVGGLTGGGLSSTVYRNGVNSDGSLDGAWESQTFTAVGLNTYFASGLAYTFAYARANPASAGSNPGNLYVFGGCNASTGGAGCTTDSNDPDVVKCNIQVAGTLTGCTNSGQQAITTPSGASSAGLAMHAGAVYANYIYLMGGVAPGRLDLTEVRYAKFDNSNNVVGVSGASWTESTVEMNNGRRRGTAFGYNGYLYAVGGYEETSTQVLDTIEFVKLNVSDGSLIASGSTFTRSSVTTSQRWGLGLAVSNSYAYVIGGCSAGAAPSSCTTLDATIQTFQVYNNDSGAPGGYSYSANLYATNRIGASAAVHNGYMYVAGGCVSTTDCTDATDNVQFAAIDANGAVSAWNNTTDPTLPGQRAYGQLEVVGGTLYFIGGQGDVSTDESADVYYGTPSTSTGNITTWTDATNDLPAARTQHSATVWNNRIYVTGGMDGSAAAQTTIYASPSLSSGGNIGSPWTTTGMTAFNVARSGHVAIAYANNLYILGGYDGTNYLSDVQFTQINSDGTLDSWTYTTSLPGPLRQADGYASNGYMYLFGGRSSTNDCTKRTLIAPISANTTIASGNNPTGIGEWYQTNRNFDGGRYGASVVSNQGKAYVLGGGCQGIVMEDDFDATHTAAEWSNTTGMTAGTTCQSTSDSNVFYLTTGGTTNQAATKDVSVTSGGTVYFKLHMPSADIGGCFRGESTGGGLLASPVLDNIEFEYSINAGGAWTQIGGDYQYDSLDPFQSYAVTIPAGAQTSATRFRWIMRDGEASDSFALEDVYIIATGSTTIAYATNSRVTQTALLSQPQIANYSRLIDANKDVFPTVWLMNGLDNSIGARWQMRYRSMNDPTVTDALKACGGAAMTGYGQETIFGDVTLGTPGAYTVKNSGGTNIGCGRYFFMTVSIDASQTYGYPDDIIRGPTLTDLALFFKANPGQRLLHGKTFIEGIQQPLDTQCGISNPVDTADVCPNP